MKKIACVILCGGQSKRMGQNKAALWFQGNTLLEYQYRRLTTFQLFSDLYISSKQNIQGSWGKHCFLDHFPVFSPLNALNSILQDSPYEENFIISVDTPFVSKQALECLIQVEGSFDAIIFQDPKQTHPLIGIYKKSALSGIQNMLSQNIHRLHDLRDFIYMQTLYHANADDFSNLNTPKDYQKALKQGA